MRIILICLLCFIGLLTNAQPPAGTYFPISGGTNQERAYFKYLHAPAGADYIPNARTWAGAGEIFIDTVGGNKGFYYRIDGHLVRLADTASSKLQGVFDLEAAKSLLNKDDTINLQGHNFVFDSLGNSRWTLRYGAHNSTNGFSIDFTRNGSGGADGPIVLDNQNYSGIQILVKGMDPGFVRDEVRNYATPTTSAAIAVPYFNTIVGYSWKLMNSGNFGQLFATPQGNPFGDSLGVVLASRASNGIHLVADGGGEIALRSAINYSPSTVMARFRPGLINMDSAKVRILAKAAPNYDTILYAAAADYPTLGFYVIRENTDSKIKTFAHYFDVDALNTRSTVFQGGVAQSVGATFVGYQSPFIINRSWPTIDQFAGTPVEGVKITNDTLHNNIYTWLPDSADIAPFNIYYRNNLNNSENLKFRVLGNGHVFAKTLRNAVQAKIVMYNVSTGELTYADTTGLGGGGGGGGGSSLTDSHMFVGDGSNTAQDVAITGDMSINNTGTVTISNNAISNAKFRTSAGLSVVGRSANSTGNVADITASSDGNVLRRSGTSIGFGSIDLSSSSAVSGNLSVSHLNSGSGASSSTFWRGDGTWGTALTSNPGWDDVLSVAQTQSTNRNIDLGGNQLFLIGSNGSGSVIVTGDTGPAMTIRSDAGAVPLTVYLSNNESGVDNGITITKITNTGHPSAGFGSSIDFTLPTDGGFGPGPEYTSARIISKYSDATSGNATSVLDFVGLNATTQEIFLESQTGGINIVNNGADTLATKAYARSVGGSGGTSSLTSAHIFVGNGSNVATDVAMSGDITINNTGVTAIGTNKVTTTTINGHAVTYAKLPTGTDNNGSVIASTASGNDFEEIGLNSTMLEIGGTGKLQIKTNGVSDSRLRQSAALSVIGNNTNSTANVADISASSAGQALTSDGSTLAFRSYIRNLTTNVTDVGNVGVGEDDLMTYSIPAGQLASTGDYIEFKMTFIFATNTNNKQIKVYYGGTNFYASTAQAQNDGSMEIVGTIIRTGATSQRISFHQVNNTTLFPDYEDYTTASETLSGAVTLKATGEATSNNDIIQKILTVKYVPVN